MKTKSATILCLLSLILAAQALTEDTNSFRVVIVPDSQGLTEHQFTEQMRWIETNRRAEPPIVAMLHMGDMVDAATPAQWAARIPGLALLTNTPFLLCPGNHDYDFQMHTNLERRLTVWNHYVPQRLYTRKTWWSGGFHANSASENAYLLVTNGVTRLLFLALEFGPRTNVLRWASNIAAAYPDHMAIVATHNYLEPSGTRNASPATAGRNDPCNPWTYSLFDGAGGEEMWQSTLKFIPNLRLVACGHRADGPFNAHGSLRGVRGNWVNEVLCDWQNTNTANLMIWTFHPSRMEVAVDTYSPVNNTHETGAANQFTMPLVDPAGSSKNPPLTGQVTWADGATTTNITFPVPMTSTNYAVYLTRPDRGGGPCSLAITHVVTTGFTLTRNTTGSGVTVVWEAVAANSDNVVAVSNALATAGNGVLTVSNTLLSTRTNSANADLDGALSIGGIAPQNHTAPGRAKNVIIDFDYLPDCAVVGGHVAALGLDKLGLIRILAMGICDNHPYAPHALHAVNLYYGRGDIAVGTNSRVSMGWDTHMAEVMATNVFPIWHGNRVFREVIGLYREKLAGAPDRSVSLLIGGPPQNLSDLWYSGPDAYSVLAGSNLMNLKVDQVMVVGGDYPTGREYNFAASWPCTMVINHLTNATFPVFFTGFTEGARLKAGGIFQAIHPADSPVRRAYKWVLEDSQAVGGTTAANGREFWEEMACMWLAFGTNFFSTNSWGGFNRVVPGGTNFWQTGTAYNQAYIQIDDAKSNALMDKVNLLHRMSPVTGAAPGPSSSVLQNAQQF